MKIILPFLLLLLSCCLGTTISHAQTAFFEPIPETNIRAVSTRLIEPLKIQTYQIDDEAFKNWLQEAPAEQSTNAGASNHILVLPTPDGNTESFRIVSYEMMEEGLAEKYPEISNYYGVGLRDASRLIRLDWTYRGFHAMIMGGDKDTYYVDPYQWEDTKHYQIYFKKDYLAPEGNTFECGVKGKADPTPAPGGNRMAGDCTFRTYRLAMATTGEYSNYHGATSPAQSNIVLSEVVTAMNRVNGIYERDMAIRMVLIANTADVFYYDGNTDPYTNNDGFTMLFENQANIDLVIGSANYDIGHVFSTGGGGIASLNSPCNNSSKARGVTGLPNPIGDPFYVDYVAHEMGHQFGANHTQNNSCQRVNATAMEPGSASTIMGYAGICSPNVQNNSDDYFHAISIQEMTANVTMGTSSTCDDESPMGNSKPMVTLAASAYDIPNGTPFVLAATSSDADGTGSHTFCWEQFDNEVATMPPQSTNTGGPAFRTFDPVASPNRYFPNLADVPNGNTWEVLPTVARTMNFRVTVRDNMPAEGCTDEADLTLTVDGMAGPFDVTAPAAAVTWTGNQTETVNWDVAGTDQAPVNCSQVDIFLSTNGGSTYPTLLADNVPNTGTASVTVPNINTATARIMVMSADNVFFDLNGGNFSITASTCTPPTAVCSNITVQLDANGSASITPADVGSNSTATCGLQSESLSQSAFGCADVGTVTVTYTITDNNNDSDDCQATVTVEDNAAPTAVCQDITVDITASGTVSVFAAEVDGGSSTACGTYTPSIPATSFGCTDVGNTVPVTLTVTDDSNGQADQCTANVTVEDPNSYCCSAPTAVCNNITVQLDAMGSASITPADVGSNSTATCGLQSENLSQSTFGCADVGTVTVTYTITDNNNNSDDCQATVTVEDNAAPTAVCQDITVDITASGTVSVSAAEVDGGSSTACGTYTPSIPATSFGCADVGNTVPVTLTVTDDSNGQADQCTANVTVEDPNSHCCSAPTAVCDNITVQLDAMGNASISPADIGSKSTAPCGLQSENLSQSTFGCADVGTVTVTYTITDNNNNSDDCQATVTVEDNAAPTAVCQDITVDITASGTVSASAAEVDGGSSTACGTYTPSIPATSFGCADVGNTVPVTLTVTDDSNGQADQCTANVTVEDPNSHCCSAPTAVCDNITVQLDAMGNASISPADIGSNSTAPCGLQSENLSQTTFGCADVGTTTTVTYTITDVNNDSDNCQGNVSIVIGNDLPNGWVSNDIGVVTAGNAYSFDPCTANNGEFTVTGSGNNATSTTTDNIAFAYQDLCGDGIITAKVESITPNGYGGLMIRESSAAGAKQVSIFSNLTNVLRHEHRTFTNGTKLAQAFYKPNPFWLRLQRQGNWVFAYYSTTGVTFSYVHAVYVPMQSCVQIGLASFTYLPNAQTEAIFSNVSVLGSSSLIDTDNLPAYLNAENKLATHPAELFPNPTMDVFTLSFKGRLSESATVRLLNPRGQLMEQRKLQPGDDDTKWNMSTLPAGMYFLVIERELTPAEIIRVVKTE